tara:strand:- start:58 stop:684 length:627 start_codon:yes stop_codon:yes gene_type:complete
MKNYFIIFLLILGLNFSTNAYSETTKTKDILIDKAKETKLLLTPPNIVKKKISIAFERIENECCEKNFPKLELIQQIKDNLQNCLDKKCHAFVLPLYSKKKPPLKLLVMKQLNELDDLIIENDQQKYNNLISKLSSEKNQIKIQNEKDIEKVKKQNLKLKKTVDKMLVNYQKKINDLENENKRLSENFNLVFEAHSKNKQKKLEKELK